MCDDRGVILFYVVGWPGSCFDSTVLDQSQMGLHPECYFRDNEWILADSGYSQKWWICTPYKKPAANIPENEAFNYLFSSCRVIIEHVNGILKGRFTSLKGRFMSLKGIRIQVKKKSDFQKVNEWIIACLILHNFLNMQHDAWDEDTDSDDDEDEERREDRDENQIEGNLRERVKVYLLNHCHVRV